MSCVIFEWSGSNKVKMNSETWKTWQHCPISQHNWFLDYGLQLRKPKKKGCTQLEKIKTLGLIVNTRMTDHEKINIKIKLKQVCENLIGQRMAAAKSVMSAAQEAANNEEKSSAGDKYETSRAMSHLEKDMHARHLAEILKELSILRDINVNLVYDHGKPGALLKCSEMSFFIAAGLGKQIVEKETVFFLSPNAPLAKSLHNKKAGDQFVFNQLALKIIDVF